MLGKNKPKKNTFFWSFFYMKTLKNINLAWSESVRTSDVKGKKAAVVSCDHAVVAWRRRGKREEGRLAWKVYIFVYTFGPLCIREKNPICQNCSVRRRQFTKTTERVKKSLGFFKFFDVCFILTEKKGIKYYKTLRNYLHSVKKCEFCRRILNYIQKFFLESDD